MLIPLHLKLHIAKQLKVPTTAPGPLY